MARDSFFRTFDDAQTEDRRWMEIISISVTLFLIMDPFGNIPAFLTILERVPPTRRRLVLTRELLLALAVIIGFVFCGRFVMGFLGLRSESVTIAGGIILFIIGLRMVFSGREPSGENDLDGEPLLVPLAIPLIAGPSLLAVLLVFSSGGDLGTPNLLGAALIAWSATFIVLFSSTFLIKFFTRRGLTAVARLMGMVLLALAVQLLIDGLTGYLSKL
jgi:multiple antibiotic resistance protein